MMAIFDRRADGPAGSSVARIIGNLPGMRGISFDAEGRGSSTGEPVDLKVVAAEFKRVSDDTKKVAETAMTELKNLNKVTEETKAAADKALTEFNAKAKELDARMAEIEQKGARRGHGAPEERKSLGDLVLENEKVKSALQRGQQWKGSASVELELKNITSATSTQGATTSVSTSLVVADRQPIVNLPDRPLLVRDLIMPGATSSNAIEYPVEVSFTNNAAPVAEGAAKPYSDITFNMVSTTVKTLAHLIKASRQIMDDAPMLKSYIDGRLRYGLGFVEEAEILYGSGQGQHLFGIIPQASAYAATFTPPGETTIDRLRVAALQATLALYPASGFVLHPTDWAKIETTKDGQGRYIVGDPTGQIAPRLWGLPVAATQAMTAGTFLTGAFRLGAQLFDRMSIEVLISTENVDDFEKNMISIRAEERLVLAVYRPAAFITGNLPA